MGDPWLYIAIAIGAAGTYLWRALGVAFAGRVAAEGRALEWITCIAYALLSALVVRMILLPVGPPLVATSTSGRAGAALVAVAVYFATRRNILAGVSAGAVAVVMFSALPWRL